MASTDGNGPPSLSKWLPFLGEADDEDQSLEEVPAAPPLASATLLGMGNQTEVLQFHPQVSQETLQSLKQCQKDPLPFAQSFMHNYFEPIVSSSYGLETSDLDDDMHSLAGFYLQKGMSTLHTHKEVISQLLGVDAELIELGLLANAIFHFDKCQRNAFQKVVAHSGLKLVAFVEVSRFDRRP